MQAQRVACGGEQALNKAEHPKTILLRTMADLFIFCRVQAMQPTRHLTRLALTLLVAGSHAQAMAGDTVLTFTGPCDNAACKAGGPDGSAPGTVTATLTLSDLTWEALGTGGYEATVSNAFNFGYNGPGSFVRVGDGDPLNGDESHLFSTTPSVSGIHDFMIVWGEPVQGSGAPGLGFLSGDATGWRWGSYSLLQVDNFLVPLPFDIHRSTQVGQWSVAVVPEPATFGLFGLGLGLVGWAARRRPRLA